MIRIQGKHNTALCYTTELDDTAAEQILSVCNEKAFKDSKIRIMPDVHAGMGCTIGTTMTITDKIVPGMVGVDIGCGMETVRLKERSIDFKALDALIRHKIPCGRQVRKIPHEYNAQIDLTRLFCAPHVKLDRAACSIGTLGGGNHFIEVDASSDGDLYLVVHSGSRHLGHEVAEHYQGLALKSLWGEAHDRAKKQIAGFKAQGRRQKTHAIHEQLMKTDPTLIPKDLTYVQGELFEAYLHDMRLVQHFAVLNRKAMVNIILEGMGLTAAEDFTTIHNYIDIDAMILRKGAVSAKAGEKLLIPINMRDGSLICLGKGNPDWNHSAPHGAGRLMSRKKAMAALSMEEYRQQMQGIYTTCVVPNTLDESPMAYKSMEDIIRNIEPTANIIDHIKPLYNFKAAE